MNEIQYKNKKISVNGLKKFGFVKKDRVYEYKAPILDGELEITVTIDRNEAVSAKVYDGETGDEYVLHTVSGATGVYVGNVREAVKNVLSRLYNECFESEIYSAGQVKAVIKHVRETYGEEPDYPFGEETFILRRADNDKWYAVFMKISAKKIGLEADEIIEVVNLKMKPEDVERLVDEKHYFTAYHMNKKHWVTIPLDTAIPTDELLLRIDDSRMLVKK